MKTDNKKQGFTTPKDYFESFEERLFIKLESECLPKKEGFKTPKDYFATFEENNLEKIIGTTHIDITLKKQPNVFSLHRSTFLKVAAMVVVLLGSFYLFQQLNVSDTTAEELALADIDNYIENGYLELDSFEISELLEDENIDGLTTTTLFSEENLEDYLLQNIEQDLFETY